MSSESFTINGMCARAGSWCSKWVAGASTGKHLQADAVVWHSLCGLQWQWLLLYAHTAPHVYHKECSVAFVKEMIALISLHIQSFHGF